MAGPFRKGRKTGMVVEGHATEKRDVIVADEPRVPTEDDERALRPRKRSPQPAPPAQPRGCWGTCALFGGLSFLVITIVLSCLLLVMVVGVVDFLRDPIDNFLGFFGFDDSAEPREVDSRTVVLGIRQMALLQTATGDIEIIKMVVDASTAPDAELRVRYIGYATAGIDLGLIGDEDVITEPDGSLTITLPPAQLTGCYLSKPDVLHRSCTDIPLAQDCGKTVDGMLDEAYDRALDELRETAYELDLLNTAYKEAESRIYDLMTRLGATQVRFQVSAEELPPATTCFP